VRKTYHFNLELATSNVLAQMPNAETKTKERDKTNQDYRNRSGQSRSRISEGSSKSFSSRGNSPHRELTLANNHRGDFESQAQKFPT